MIKKPFYIDVVKDSDHITSWLRNHDGELVRTEALVSDYSYCFIPANDGGTYPYKDLYGKMVKPIWFENDYSTRSYGEKHSNALESDVGCVTRYMLDEFHDADIETPYRLAFYDIEVDFDLSDGNGYPKPENPFGEVNSIQIFDCHREVYMLFLPSRKAAIVNITDTEYPVEIHPTASERDMLDLFAEYLKDVDIIGGWFTDGFDLPYIMARAHMLFGEKKALTMFCRDGFSAKKREYVDPMTQEDKVKWTLVGVQHVDMMELYKKFNPGQLAGGFGLNSVCEHEEVGKKIDYTGDLGELYRRDPQRFYEYAIHDVRLLKDLDVKTDTIKLAVMMSRESCVHVSDVSGTVKPVENAFMKYCRDNGGYVLPTKNHHQREKFPGAIVYDTVSGVHKWVTSFDITALYPHVMIMLGLSTETLVMQIQEEYEGFILVTTQSDELVTVKVEATNDVVSISGKELHDIILEEGYTISANGTIFRGDLGLLSAFVQSIFDKRVDQKRAAKEYYKAGDTLNGSRYNLFQKVTKIFANSLYGCIGNVHFRLFDLRMARSITLTGQLISKQQAVAANAIMEEIS